MFAGGVVSNPVSIYRAFRYVCDEANVETDGMKPMGRLANDWGWEAAFVSRVQRLIQRDYNHACIIMWSLGNESGRGRNLMKARQAIQALDNTRPICYEGGKNRWTSLEGIGFPLAKVSSCFHSNRWFMDRRGRYHRTHRHYMPDVSRCRKNRSPGSAIDRKPSRNPLRVQSFHEQFEWKSSFVLGSLLE